MINSMQFWYQLCFSLTIGFPQQHRHRLNLNQIQPGISMLLMLEYFSPICKFCKINIVIRNIIIVDFSASESVRDNLIWTFGCLLLILYSLTGHYINLRFDLKFPITDPYWRKIYRGILKNFISVYIFYHLITCCSCLFIYWHLEVTYRYNYLLQAAIDLTLIAFLLLFLLKR